MEVAQWLTRLASVQRLFLDTMIFVYALEDHPQYGALSAAILAHIEAGACDAITSALTLTELLTAPAQRSDITALHDYELFLSNFPHLQIVAFEAAHARTVARIRANSGLRTPDAIQLATAHSAGCDAVLTNDTQWRGKTETMTLILLDDST